MGYDFTQAMKRVDEIEVERVGVGKSILEITIKAT